MGSLGTIAPGIGRDSRHCRYGNWAATRHSLELALILNLLAGWRHLDQIKSVEFELRRGLKEQAV